MTTATPLIGLALVVLCLSNWLAATVFVRLARQAPDVRTLRERAVGSVLGATAVTGGSTLWWLLAQDPPGLPLGTILAAGLVAIVVAALPALYWLLLFLRGTFDGDEVAAGTADPPTPTDPSP